MVGYFAYDIVHSLFSQVKNHQVTRPLILPMPGSCSRKTASSSIIWNERLFIFSSPFLTYDADPATEYRRCAAHIAELAADRVDRRNAKNTGAPAQTINKTPQNAGKSPAVTDNTGQGSVHACGRRDQRAYRGRGYFPGRALAENGMCGRIGPVPHLRGAAGDQPEPVHVLP